jgi:glutamate N-acetyltransferase / amino-acid N-acetyltransferase
VKLPLGYRYSALYAGIRKVAKPDLALIVSDAPAAAAAMFTTNRVQAAPLKVCQEHLSQSGGRVRALLINAGNANCATRTGQQVANATSKVLAAALNAPAEQVLPSSTGVIGVELDGTLITKAIPALVAGLSADRFTDAADAILTTDTFRKVAQAEWRGTRIAGMTKGAGMIQPNMATTLGYVLTDAVLTPAQAKKLLGQAVERSYHRISVDGDTSTNDTVVLLANGASGKKPGPGFEKALFGVFESLAQQIVRDGEGARKLVHIEIRGGKTDAEAARMARSIANSPLVKTAIAGSDANWGRILAAAGYSGVIFDPSKTDIWLQGVKVCRRGLAAPFDEPAMKKRLDEKDCFIRLSLPGTGSARFWTCDLTEGYIEINASYRT